MSQNIRDGEQWPGCHGITSKGDLCRSVTNKRYCKTHEHQAQAANARDDENGFGLDGRQNGHYHRPQKSRSQVDASQPQISGRTIPSRHEHSATRRGSQDDNIEDLTPSDSSPASYTLQGVCEYRRASTSTKRKQTYDGTFLWNSEKLTMQLFDGSLVAEDWSVTEPPREREIEVGDYLVTINDAVRKRLGNIDHTSQVNDDVVRNGSQMLSPAGGQGTEDDESPNEEDLYNVEFNPTAHRVMEVYTQYQEEHDVARSRVAIARAYNEKVQHAAMIDNALAQEEQVLLAALHANAEKRKEHESAKEALHNKVDVFCEQAKRPSDKRAPIFAVILELREEDRRETKDWLARYADWKP